MTEVVHKTEEVFGIGRETPLNYVERSSVDSPFFQALSRDKHIVIYGSSKQGKTSLRKTWLSDKEHVSINCLNSMNIAQLHNSILKKVGYRVEQTTSKSADGSWKFTAELKGKVGIPLFVESTGGGSGEYSNKTGQQTVSKKLEIDLSDVNDIIAALEEADAPKHIVLEDFHYLPVETQSSFSIALKAFHEESDYIFIIIGVWREKNRLIYFNGDLTSRVVAIDADNWSDEELKSVVRAGEPLLNVHFTEQFVDGIVRHSHNAVYLVQEGCANACLKEEIYQTSDGLREVGRGIDTAALIKDVVDEQAGRYSAFLANVADGFQKSNYEMYRWLLYSLMKCPIEDLQGGIRRSRISKIVKEHHPLGDKLNEGNITQALVSLSSLQVNKNIRPLILDYDQTHKILNVVDRAFLVWLAYQDRDELADELLIVAAP